MKIIITTKLIDVVMAPHAWDDRYEVYSDHPQVTVLCKNEEAGRNFIKGACLNIIAGWAIVPNEVRFVMNEYITPVPVGVVDKPKLDPDYFGKHRID